MSNIVTNYSTTIITIFQDVIRSYENNLRIIDETQGELQDLLHEAEMASPKDMYNGWKIYRDIREARLKRRKAKEENELLKDMYEYLSSQQGQGFKTKMQQLQSNAAKLRTTQESRVYTPRQRTDLTITDKTCDAHRPFEELMKEFNKTKITNQKGKLRK